MKTFQDPLDEFSRIARNKPHPGIEKNYPKVTDGTSSSIVNKTPRRIIQQLPTGRVISDTEDWLTIVASFIYTNRILLNANMQFALFEKCIQMVKGGLQNGSKTAYTPFVMRGSYFGPDMKLVGDKDIFFEAGKLSDTDSNFVFLRSWYQKKDIEAEIAKHKQLAKSYRERGEKYKCDWDLKKLEQLKDEITTKADEDMTEAEKKLKDSQSKGGIELVTAFQRGVGGKFYTFSPKLKEVVKTKENKDPRGDIPLDTLYMDTDGVNPLGWGIIEQLAPLQNLIDSEMQMYQFERALMLAPPTIKKGNWNKSQAKLVPNAIVDLGSDPNATWEVLKRESSALAQFPDNYGLMKSQLLTLASSPDATISSKVGNPQFSKTDAGVDMQQANVSVDDNHIRKKFEGWFERWSETAINLYFAERTGMEELQLDKETALKLRNLEDEGKLQPGFVSDDNKIQIDYDSATPALKFEVDASTSNMKNDQQQLEALDGLINRLEGSQVLQQYIPPKKIIGAWNAIVAASGVENPEDLTVSDEEMEEAEQAQMQQEQAMAQGVDPATGQPMPANDVQSPQEGEIPPEVASDGEEAQIHQELAQLDELEQEAGGDQADPEQEIMSQLDELDGIEGQLSEGPVDTSQLEVADLAFITSLRDMGYPDDKVQYATVLTMDERFSNEDIISMIGLPPEGALV